MTTVLEPIVLTADVLVIGGGMAGTWAAAAAAGEGARVVLVDKGYCGTSGVTATAGPGHWWVPPEGREAAVANRVRLGLGLGDPDWMHRILDETWRVLPTLAPYYAFGVDEMGVVNYRSVRGPEYLRALRRLVLDLGVTILDQSPALELLARGDGSVAGARGVRRQDGHRPYEIRAGGVVLAAGGTSFLSHLLGSHTNTGDGYLMAAEAGAELSGMEFTGAYTVAPAHTTMTRTMAYSFATYYDADGRELNIPFGPDQTERLGRALLAGPVFCSLHRLPEDVRERLHLISPNVPLVFDRRGIDPYRDRFKVTLHTDGTIRGIGGVRVVTEECGTAVPGLFVAGDTASREKVAGAISGGGNVNSAWALSSGRFAGRAAARLARRRPPNEALLVPLGEAGLQPRRSPKAVDVTAARQVVKEQMHPLDKGLFRTGRALSASRDALDAAWTVIADHGQGGLAVRETAALIATARWSVASAQHRAESRGLHRRLDAPGSDPRLAVRLLSGGFETVWVAPDGHRSVVEPAPALETVP